jgi:hypothetical protein
MILLYAVGPGIVFEDDEIDGIQQAPAKSPETPDSAILRFLGRFLDQGMDVRAFKNKLDADPVHRAQMIMHARVLRDRGIAVSNDLVDAVLERLVDEQPRTA